MKLPLWHNLSLRTRLALAYGVLLAVILCALGGALYLDTRRFLLDSTARRARAQAKPVIEHWLYPQEFMPPLWGEEGVSGVSPSLEKIAPFLARDLTSKDTVATVLDTRGRVLALGRRLPEEPPPPPLQPSYYRRALAGENEVSYTTWVDGYHLLVLYIPLRDKPGGQKVLGVVQLGVVINSVDKILLRQGLVLLLGIGLALLAGVGLVFLVTTSMLKDLTGMVATCRSIAEGNLGHRVNLPRGKDEVGDLALAFNEMVDRIEASFDAQKKFVAKAAHELRTPVTVILGSLEVLMRGAQDDPEISSKLIQNMYQAAWGLSRLCEDLLDLSRLDLSAHVRKERVSLSDFFSSFMGKASILAKGRKLVLEKGPPVFLEVDPRMLEQMLYNLLDNAVRHTREGEAIHIGWDVKGEEVEVWVADEGEGISPHDLPYIFEPFYQGGRAENRGGTGLGLTLVKTMIEAHGGRIEVESLEGQGARFVLLFPLSKS